MTLETAVRDFLGSVSQEYDVLKYFYNTSPEDFIANQTPVYYSGPYWDQEEIVAMFHGYFRRKVADKRRASSSI